MISIYNSYLTYRNSDSIIKLYVNLLKSMAEILVNSQINKTVDELFLCEVDFVATSGIEQSF